MAYRPKKTKKDLGGFRSLLEKNFSGWLKKLRIKFLYEPCKIPYTVPAKERTYTPDFVIVKSSRVKSLSLDDLDGLVILETKGRLTYSDSQKMIWVKEQNPDLDIRMIFPEDRIFSKNRKGRDGGKYRYSDWSIDNGFPYFIGTAPPKEWLSP